jgi:hypothetical protein
MNSETVFQPVTPHFRRCSRVAAVYFLLVDDRQQGKLIFRCPYTDSNEAVNAYEKMEETYREDKSMEIVFVGAGSIETVMLTHGNNFDVMPSASPYLAGV